MRFGKRKLTPTVAPLEPFSLDTPLLWFGKDAWTTRDACEGTQIFGQIGSGKTSGSGASLAKAFLRAGFGGLILCAKPEERRLWEQYARETGREKHLVIFSPHEDPYHQRFWRFNFLDYERQRATAIGGGGLIDNLVQLFTTINEIIEGKAQVAEGDNFWERAMRQLIRATVTALNLAEQTLTMEAIIKLVLEAPKTEEQPFDEHWQRNSFCAGVLRKADKKVEKSGNPRDQHDFEQVFAYWTKDYASLADRTKSSVVTTFSSLADCLAYGHIWELLGTETSLVPEATFDGALIILDLPIQQYHSVGRITQGIFKYMFQRAVLAREVTADTRPVFLWADEAQNFISSLDFEYQAVARSAKAPTVYLTQNISNYYAVLGAGGRDAANALLGNFGTKIFSANGDVPTNTWAADTIGQHWTTTGTSGTSHSAQGPSTSASGSDSVQYKVMPSAFTTLRKGGPANHGIVEAYIFQGGRIWKETEDTYIKVRFRQGA